MFVNYDDNAKCAGLEASGVLAARDKGLVVPSSSF